ncbi:30S ribosomal protein S17 [Candidatus Gracilibacteria bacterium]|nr:30S ribosomal protein S17 [Candidatus Gracilibacteria bacterium]
MRKLKGIVTSDAMDKTAVVSIDTKKPHPIYKKKFIKTKKFHIHDENNECSVGDMVVFQESRPLSKNKRWTLVEKIAA